MPVELPTGATAVQPYLLLPSGTADEAMEVYKDLFAVDITNVVRRNGMVMNVQFGRDNQKSIFMLGESPHTPQHDASDNAQHGMQARYLTCIFVDDVEKTLEKVKALEGFTVVRGITVQHYGVKDIMFTDKWGQDWNAMTFLGDDDKFYMKFP
ncbi:hypothetical protein T439DRAFT_323627 [Meredithblackwellia eburnea MCA 4105]